MLTRPSFKPHLRVAVVPEEGVFVLSGANETLLRGRLYELVVPHLDGRSADEICDRVAPRLSAAQVYFTVAQLEKKGFLAEACDELPREEAAWWSMQQIDPLAASRRLAAVGVSIEGAGTEVGPLASALAAAGVRVQEGGDLDVVLADHYLQPQLAARNEAALASGRPWLLVKPVGRQLWLGPLIRPGVTGCWKCLAERLRANRAVESYVFQRLADEQAASAAGDANLIEQAGTAGSRQVACALVAETIASWVVRGELPECEGKIRTFDLVSWQVETHTLTRLPYCPACGKPANGDVSHFQPPRLESRQKRFVRDGGHRAVGPDVTLERFRHHISPITGAVSMLERSSPSDDGVMHVYLSGHNLARRHHSLGQLRGDLRNMSAGKGTTDAQAKASGLCEGLERHSGVFRGDEPRRLARLSDLGESGIDPRTCLLFSPRQYGRRDEWNRNSTPYNFVPLPFDAEAEWEWSPVWSLSRQEVCWLPTAFCYYDYPLPKDKQFCLACSNGNAAGNTLEEAVLQGFLELVERDSVALWWYSRVQRPGVDLASFHEPYLSELGDYLATRGREMAALDLTADLQIPVFAAWSRRTDGPREEIVIGFGAHLDARIALLRAVTEMNQMLSYVLQVPREQVYNERLTDEETVRWLKTATMENQPYLMPAEKSRPRRSDDYLAVTNDDLLDDVRHCQSLVERRGLQMLVLDQTRPEIGLPVVKVVVPGLRHFWARFAPGRLFEVPVKLGWLERRLAEEELNPVPMFL
ncbi:MAG TPA: TOMM precursor leader peptide-binding protein [Pirellulales bacterium]|nr:TOMM precursor leader peptide-binding protein [Pirellulales bacterium]